MRLLKMKYETWEDVYNNNMFLRLLIFQINGKAIHNYEIDYKDYIPTDLVEVMN